MQRTNGQHYVVKHVHRLLIAVTFLGCKDCVARVVRRCNLKHTHVTRLLGFLLLFAS